MNRYDEFVRMNIDQLAEWLDKYADFDGSPWMKWFDESYCLKCGAIMCSYPGSTHMFPVSYCELEHHCRFFPDKPEPLTNLEIIRMWLEQEAK